MAESPSAFQQILRAVTTGNFGVGPGDYPPQAYQTQGEADKESERQLRRRQTQVGDVLKRIELLQQTKGLTHRQALEALKPEDIKTLVEHYANGKGEQ